MADPALLVALGSVGTLAITAAAGAALKAWEAWLEVRRLEIEARRSRGPAGLDLAELKERVRRIEAIAEGTGL